MNQVLTPYVSVLASNLRTTSRPIEDIFSHCCSAGCSTEDHVHAWKFTNGGAGSYPHIITDTSNTLGQESTGALAISRGVPNALGGISQASLIAVKDNHCGLVA